MRRAPVLAVTATIGFSLASGLVACARDSGGWPALAPRAAERRSVKPDPVQSPREVVAPAEAVEADTPADPVAASSFARLRPRILAVEAALSRALANASHATAQSEQWAVAEVELSRAEQLLGDLDALLPAYGSRAGVRLVPADVQARRAALSRMIDSAKRALAR